jgi:methylated-DNA-[protein]-cysteine S-methyltransferase
VIRRLRAHLGGRPDSLDDVPIDPVDATPFRRRVWTAARRVGPGRTTTYGAIAAELGLPGAARAVGGALGRNPVPLIVPCHRVLGASGGGGFSGPGGLRTKRRLLAIEGAARSAEAGAATVRGPRHAKRSGRAPAARHLRGTDPRWAAILDRVGPFALQRRRGTHFGALVEAIVHQQLAGAAAAAIHRRLRALVGGETGVTPAAIDRLPDRALAAAGLSGPKRAALRDLAAGARDGRLPFGRLHRMDDDRVVSVLSAVRGIGRWTAQMFLIFRLCRPDVLPTADYGLRKAVQRVWGLPGLPSERDLVRLAEPWRPHRTAATWYLWRSGGPVLLAAPPRVGAG